MRVTTQSISRVIIFSSKEWGFLENSRIWHCHTTKTFQSLFLYSAITSLSLIRFAESFLSQKSTLLFGLDDFLHPSCWCQKQPCTKITVLYLGSTISGLPGRSLRLMRNLKPSLWRIDRIIFSGLVSLLLIRDITWLRFSGEKTSMSWAYQNCVVITILHLPAACLPTFHSISPTPPLSFCNPYLSVPFSIRNHANLPYILPNGVILFDWDCSSKICSNQDFFLLNGYP